MDPDQIVADAVSIAQAAGLCFLVTAGSDGRIDARLMQPFAWERDTPIWFGTSPSSRKAREIAEGGPATVCFQSPSGGAYAAVQGTIAMDSDRQRRRDLWRPEWDAYFPGGPDDNYVLLRFDPERIEVLDFPAGIAPEPYGACAAAVGLTANGWEAVVDQPGPRPRH